MKQKAKISITGIQTVDDDQDSVEILTDGFYYEKGGSFYIMYNEAESSGMQGCKTILKIDGEAKKAVMTRSGSAATSLMIEPGKRHVCQYNVGPGDILLGISSAKISSNLSQEGGRVDISYCLDVNTQQISENQLKINVELQGE